MTNFFLERYKRFGQDIDPFEIVLSPSIRANTLKISESELIKRFKDKGIVLKKVSELKYCYTLDKQDFSLASTPEYLGGLFYIQEVASQVPGLVLDPQPGDTVLDMCAAPGSKTTQLASIMKNKGLIVANDIEIKRLKALSLNLQRCGVSNTVMTYMKGYHIKERFDKILLDAPCSGTGIIRKSLHTLEIWNQNMLKKLSNDQKRLLVSGFECLNEDGILVYSTCSIDKDENEDVIQYLLDKYDNIKLENIEIDIKRSEVLSDNKELKKCLRIWPQDNNSSGFFVAKIRKC